MAKAISLSKPKYGLFPFASLPFKLEVNYLPTKREKIIKYVSRVAEHSFLAPIYLLTYQNILYINIKY